MKTLEEKLWDLIDGTATAEEANTLKKLLETDAEANSLYLQLLELNTHFNSIDIDEPSMSFTRNVMDKVALEVRPVALKTKTNKVLIRSIGWFFSLSLIGIFIYAIAGSGSLDVDLPAANFALDLEKYVNTTSITIFLFVDVVLALLYFDSVLRRKLHAQKKGATV